MPKQPLFAGLVVDEEGNVAETAMIGDEPFYVVNDAGFRRHISAEQVDRAVLLQMQDLMKGNESMISEQTAKMLGQDDIFSKAMIEQQLKNIDKQFDALMQAGAQRQYPYVQDRLAGGARGLRRFIFFFTFLST